MKTFLIFLFTTMVVTAAPHTAESDENKLQHVILEEIIQSVKDIKDQIKAEIFVQNVISAENCMPMNFCKAGNILSVYKAEELGLKKDNWLLPRKLIAYTRNITCKQPASVDLIYLHQLLDNINQCAQKQFSKH